MARKKKIQEFGQETVLVHFYDPVRKDNYFVLTTRDQAEVRQLALLMEGMEKVRIPLFEFEKEMQEKGMEFKPLPQKRIAWNSAEAKSLINKKKKRASID